MTHDEAFLQAIREAPDDDAPRLIYADWLEEHGQTDRAEFIRIQCRRFGISDMDPNAPGLQARAEELLRDNWDVWVGPLRELVGPRYDRYGEMWLREEYNPEGLRRFQRGFVDAIILEVEHFLNHANELLVRVPLRALGLWGAGGHARALADCPHLAGLKALAFYDYFSDPLTARDAPALAASPYLQGLTHLGLGMNSLADEGVEALARAQWLKSLVTLDLTENGITDIGALALANCSHLGQLQTLLLRHNAISRRGRKALSASCHLRQVSRLELNG
ncbi:MAG TPA: TIGR02996 domain-containing protein [Gemmataceae bacterium]|jgi:uncharacterized protein (TIGR02996 family)